jgi:hypothetical protein
MTDIESELALILELALAQRPDPQGWSLIADTDWLVRSYLGSGYARRLDAHPRILDRDAVAISDRVRSDGR